MFIKDLIVLGPHTVRKTLHAFANLAQPTIQKWKCSCYLPITAKEIACLAVMLLHVWSWKRCEVSTQESI